MINRYFTLTILLLLAVCLVGCGGGSGSSEFPEGVDGGLPSIVKLMPVKSVAQTNTTIALTTKVLDGNGEPVPNVEVIYTNLSTLGVLSGTKARTNSMGQATVTIFSSDVGFATIQAEVAKGTQWVRDRKVVFYSPFDLTLPTGATATPTLTLDVDSNANGIFDEPADFILLDGPNNDESIIRATVKDETGSLVVGDGVVFCAFSTEASFPLHDATVTGCIGAGAFALTGINGQAEVLMKVNPTILRSVSTILNVSAMSLATSAGNLVSFFLRPVTVGAVTVTANPTTVDSGGTSEITAVVTTSSGGPVPDGTTVNFTTNMGAVEPFAQTTDGAASVQWTAPEVTTSTSATITASAGGKSGSATITITAPPVALQVIPAARSVNSGAAAQTVTFTVSGGTGPYIVDSINPALVSVPASTTGALTATIAANACPGSVTITITDSTGAAVTATVNITAPPLAVVPAAVTCSSVASSSCTSSTLLTITGGVPTYTPSSANTSLATTSAVSATAPYTFDILRGATALPIIPPAVTATPQNINVTVTDRCGATATVVVTVN